MDDKQRVESYLTLVKCSKYFWILNMKLKRSCHNIEPLTNQ